MKTDISVVLDRSGSMEAVKHDTIGGFNTFLKEQQALPGEALLSLAQFDSMGYDRIIDAKPIKQAEPLTPLTFVPRGNTPLLDSMCKLITETGARFKQMPESARPENVIVVIITDGEENASVSVTRDQVLAMITHQQDVYKWKFIYLGANQDAIAAAKSFGIPQAMAATYTADADHMQVAYGVASHMVREGRSGRTMAISSSQRKNLVKNQTTSQTKGTV